MVNITSRILIITLVCSKLLDPGIKTWENYSEDVRKKDKNTGMIFKALVFLFNYITNGKYNQKLGINIYQVVQIKKIN